MDLIKVDKRVERTVRKAMSKLVLDSPFFSVLLLQQDLIYTLAFPTFATDGNSIYVNPLYAQSLTQDEIKGVLVHELMHTVLMHLTRRGERDPGLFNAAADYAVNPIIKAEGFVLPNNHLDEPRFHKMTADAIYNILEKENPIISPDLMDIVEIKHQSADQKSAQEQKSKINVAKALAAAGDDVPDIIKKMVREALEVRINWKDKLRQFIQVSLGNDEQTWRKPNRNYIHDDLYLPSYEGKTMPAINIAIDTSGSIYANENLFKEFGAEINKIVADLVPEQVDIYYVDTKVRRHDTYEEGEQPEYTLEGGGGTDFTTLFKDPKVAQASCLIFFTDMYASGMPKNYDIPILWCCYGNKNPDKDVAGEIILVET